MVREEQPTTGCRSNKTQPRQICSREWQTGRIADESILAASQWNKTFCFPTREKPVHHGTYVFFIRVNQFLCKQMITISIFFFCFPLGISPRLHNYSFYSNIYILITTSPLDTPFPGICCFVFAFPWLIHPDEFHRPILIQVALNLSHKSCV